MEKPAQVLLPTTVSCLSMNLWHVYVPQLDNFFQSDELSSTDTKDFDAGIWVWSLPAFILMPLHLFEIH